MRSRVERYVNDAARMTTRAVSHRLLAAGLACLGLVVAGCSAGSTALMHQGQVQADVNSTHYTVQDLGVVGANFFQPGQPYVVSNNGWVGGEALEGSVEHAVLWHEGKMIDIGDPGLGGGNSQGYGVNESGVAAGAAETTAGGRSTTEDFCGFQFTGFTASATPCVPIMWREGKMVPLRTLGGVNGIANEINNSGAIAGYAENRTLDHSCGAPQKYQFKPVAWFEGEIQELQTGNDAEGVAYSINDYGEVAGTTGPCGPLNPIWFFYLIPSHAVLWTDGKATDLGNLGGALNNLAHHVNNLGQVVGGSDLAGDQTSHAFLWTREANMQDLGTVNDKVNNDTFSVGLGINDAGRVVGVSSNADSSIIRAFVRQNGALVDLNSLITGSNSLYLVTACSINSKGEIIRIALDLNTGQTHAYLASPTHEASEDISSTRRMSLVIPESVRSRLRFATPVQ